MKPPNLRLISVPSNPPPPHSLLLQVFNTLQWQSAQYGHFELDHLQITALVAFYLSTTAAVLGIFAVAIATNHFVKELVEQVKTEPTLTRFQSTTELGSEATHSPLSSNRPLDPTLHAG